MKWTQEQVTQMQNPDRDMQPPDPGIASAKCDACGFVAEQFAKCRCCGDTFCWRCDSDQALRAQLHSDCAFTSYDDDRKRWADTAESLGRQNKQLASLTCSSIRDGFILTESVVALRGMQRRMELYGKDEE